MAKSVLTLLSRDQIAGQLARFGVVGVVGFCVDAFVLYVCLWAGLGFYIGRLFSYLTAASATWVLNRAFTFAHSGTARRHRQWAKFVILNSFGGLLNYGVYAMLILTGEPFETHPILAVAAGSISGMVLNFWLSRTFVFSSVK